MVIYHFYNTDRCHLTIFLRVLICYEALLSIIKRGPQWSKKNRKGYPINIGIFTKFVTLVIKEKTRNTLWIPFKSMFS